MEPGLDVVGQEGAQHEDPPEAEDDARDRSQRLHERPDHQPQAPGCELAQEEPDRERERRCDEERDQRCHRGPEEPGRRPEDALVRIPNSAPHEREAEGAEGDVRAAQDLVGDDSDQGDRPEPRGQGQDQEEAVAQPVANAPPAP